MLPERCFSLQVGMALRAVLLLLFSVGEAGSFPWEGNAFPKVDAAYSCVLKEKAAISRFYNLPAAIPSLP